MPQINPLAPAFQTDMTESTSVDSLIKALTPEQAGVALPTEPGVLGPKPSAKVPPHLGKALPRTSQASPAGLNPKAAGGAKDLGAPLSVSLKAQGAGVSGTRAKGTGFQVELSIARPIKNTTVTGSVIIAHDQGKVLDKPVNASFLYGRAGVTHKLPLGPKTTVTFGALAGGQLVFKEGGARRGPAHSDGLEAFFTPSATVRRTLLDDGRTKLSAFGGAELRFNVAADGINPAKWQVRPKAIVGVQLEVDTEPTRKGPELSLTATASLEYRIGLNGSTAGAVAGAVAGDVPGLSLEAKYKVTDDFSVFATIGTTLASKHPVNSIEFSNSGSNEGPRVWLGGQINF